MKQISNWDLRNINNDVKKIIYNKVNGVYTVIANYNDSTVAQFDTERNVCVYQNCGYFMAFETGKLQKLLNNHIDKIVEVGGLRAVKDAKRKQERNW